MFRLHKLKSQKTGARFNFTFSNFQALQVPAGWDKLSVSIISVETGKTITRSGKASVRNGNCRWTETLSESIWIPQDDGSKEIEEYLLKFVVAMGSARSGILGEATVNLGSYMTARSAVPISLPLKKCNYGTILKVKVQCLTPRAKVRDEQRKDTNLEDENDDMEKRSDVSDSTLNRSAGSSSSNHLDGTIHPGELSSRDPSFSASGSRHSFDSMEDSFRKENYSPQSDLSGLVNNIGRQDSTGSQSSSHYGSYSFNDSSRSNDPSFNSKVSGSASHVQNHRDDFNHVSLAIPSSPLRNSGSSRELEAAKVTIEELRAEARMWEHNARKMVIDMEKLQQELLDQSKHQSTLEMELSASQRECDGLKQEIEHLRILLDESPAKETATENMKFQTKDVDSIQKGLEEEIKFRKEENTNLALQLHKTQEANIELVSILQELEETIQKQKMEIDNLSRMKLEFHAQTCGQGCEEGRAVNSCDQVLETMRESSCDSDQEGGIAEHLRRDLHVEFETEEKSNLEHQLRQFQELKNNLESTIQSLEKTLDEKNHEIEVERCSKSQVLHDCEAEWSAKLAEKEVKIASLETELSAAHHGQGLMEKGFENENNHNWVTEIESLQQKVQELERDCNELTDENLELLLKLKESKKDLLTCDTCSNSCSHEYLVSDFLQTSEYEVSELKSQPHKLEEELTKEIAIQGFSADHFRVQCGDLEKKCTDLEIQLEAFREKTSYLDCELCTCRARTQEQEKEIVALQQQLECYKRRETEGDGHLANVCTDSTVSESHATIEMSKLLVELHEQIQLSLANAEKQHHALNFPTETGYTLGSDNSVVERITGLITQKAQAEIILKKFVQLKELLEEKTAANNEPKSGKEARTMDINFVEVLNNLEVNTSDLGYESLHTEPKLEDTDPDNEQLEKIDEIDKLKSDNLLKQEEIEALRHYHRELESQISNLQNEKSQLEESTEHVLKEDAIKSKCLDDLRNEIDMLRSNMDSQVSANKVLVRTSAELESGKHELEIHLSELEAENVQLSERICGLEAQLRYLTDAKESNRLELQNSESCATNLKDEIKRLETEMEAQKVDMKKELQDMHNLWLEAQKEYECLKLVNPKLQATAESLIEECSLLQKSNRDLRKQNTALHEQCTLLEAELKESEKKFSNIFVEVEALEEKYYSVVEEIASKEKALHLELDALLRENKKHEEKLASEESVLNQVYLEKRIEVESLKREVAHLTEQISATHDEKERPASEAVLEVSHLRADKAILEASLQEVQGKLKLCESNLATIQMQSEAKIQGLIGELAASRHNQEVMMSDHEKLLNLLEDFKSKEDKLKSTVRGLELQVKASEYERLQLAEEISSLKDQLQRMALLQEEILSAKRLLSEVKLENERLETSLQILIKDHEELQAERILFVEKISDYQKTVSSLEDCKNKKVLLEEKLLRLEGDLAAREALGTQEATLKNELAQIRRENSQLQRKIKYLEEEKEECMRRAQALEEEMKLKKVHQDLPDPYNPCLSPYPEDNAASTSTKDKLNVLLVRDEENNTLQFGEQPFGKTEQLQQHSGLNQKQVDDKQNLGTGSSQVLGTDPLLKIQSLENELAEALEANDLYKAQLKSLLSQGQSAQLDSPMKPTIEKEPLTKDGYEHKLLLLETELKDLRERYLQMSLNYADVEAEREQLVMKLKSVNTRRKWF